MSGQLAIGTRITVLHQGQPLQATIYAASDEADITAFGYKPAPQPHTYQPHTYVADKIAGLDPNGVIFPEDEGVEWLAGWDADAGAVLLATQALRPEPEGFFGTSTGRWQHQQPNLQNYPKRASGKR